MGKRFGAAIVSFALALTMALPSAAFAADENAAEAGIDVEGLQEAQDERSGSAEAGDAAADEASDGAGTSVVTVSAEGDAAIAEGAAFGAADFSRAARGSNREIDGASIGYRYNMGDSPDRAVAVATETDVIVYVPASASDLFDIDSASDRAALQSYFIALDDAANNAGIVMSASEEWHYTTETTYELDGLVYTFAIQASDGRYYVGVTGVDDPNVVANDQNLRPTHVCFLSIAAPEDVNIVAAATGFDAIGEFFEDLDWSPLWVSLKTTGVAIVFIFILGLAAAYFCLRIPKRVQDVADAIFTIPMVLPPTVCGFLLLWLLGNASPTGQWLRSLGIELTFTWPATVIAAVVVAFPLMYRTARGAFEGLDPNMLDAARTLGWSNVKIFFKLMVPLAWSSIAAGTVLAFARALGEFGATLFVAGNHAGITTTLPIAIYFEWMGGNDAAAWFWAGVIIVFSFLVIVFVNLWSRRTTKYRRRNEE